MPKISNKDIYDQDPSLDMEDYLLGTNNGTSNKKTQTYSLGSVFSLFYNFLGFNAFLFTTDTDTYPIASLGCFFAFDENDEITDEIADTRKLTFSSNDTYNFNVTNYLELIINSGKFLFKLINLEDKDNFVYLRPSNFVISNTLTSFDINVEVSYGLQNGNFVNYKKYLLLLEFDANTFFPEDYDLSEFNNLSSNPFVRNNEFQEVTNDINSIINPDRIITIGTETILADEYSYEGYVWQLGGVEIDNAGNPSTFIIPAATVGFKRKDISVFTTEGNIIRVAGDETDGDIVATPPTPPGTLYFKSYDINGDTVEADPEPPAIDGTIYKQKIENIRFKSNQLGSNVIIDFRPEGYFHYSVINSGLISVAGFSTALLSSAISEGQDILFENQTGNPITLKNMFGSAPTKINLATDLVVPNEGKIWFRFRNNELELIMKSWVDLSTKADLVSGKVPATQLPSYVDDVLEFANLAAFPVTGETGKIYLALDTNFTYRWSGSAYVQISDNTKLDKSTTPSSVYATDASGNQEMRSISELGGGKEYTFNTTVSQSFGDSIAVGQNSTGDNSYIKLLCALYGTTNTNRAVSGRGIWEACRLHNANVNPSTNTFSVVMAGFNDVRRGGNDAKTFSKIENGYKGIIVNQFMRTSIAGGAVSASITKSGTWLVFTSDMVGGKYSGGTYSQTSGNYIEYAFSDNNVTLGMIGGDGVNQIYGNFDVHIDGILQGSYSVNNKTDGISDGSNNNQRAPYILFFTGLADGNHTIRVTLTNNLPVPIDYFGHLNDPNLCTPILLMEAPRMNSTGYAIAPANANDTIIDELNALINSVAGLFSSQFPIIIAKTNDYYDITTGLDTDNIHPNNLGHRQIYQSAYEALREVILIRNLAGINLLNSNNSWTGTNDYTQRVKTSSGFQAQGGLSTPTGVGVEIEYTSSEGFVTSYNRTLSSWVNLNIRGAILKFISGGAQRMEVNTNGLKLNTLPTYANDASAATGGLTAGQLYKTSTGEVRVKL